LFITSLLLIGQKIENRSLFGEVIQTRIQYLLMTHGGAAVTRWKMAFLPRDAMR